MPPMRRCGWLRLTLSDWFGSKNLQGRRTLTAAQMEAHRFGKPFPMSYDEIVDDLSKGRSGARGMAFIRYPPTTENPYGSGHVVTGRNTLGNVRFRDPSNS